jgi:hypothetical protein
VASPRSGAQPRTLEERVKWLEDELRAVLIRVDTLDSGGANAGPF